jgi:hypothetical protein
MKNELGMGGRAGILVLALFLSLGRPAWAQVGLPDPQLTPGALNPAVTQDNIGETICVRGWTRTVRPSERYTSTLKRRQIHEYGYADRRLGHYEEDHLVPLGLGGAPYDPRNLWPEPRSSPDGWDADRKNELEYALNRLVCRGRVALAAAQRAIATNWIAAYQRYMRDAE